MPRSAGHLYRFQNGCRDEHRSSEFAKQTIARQGDLPALRRYVTLDLPPANCIRSECRTSNARPYAASREECRDEHCSSADTHPRPAAASIQCATPFPTTRRRDEHRSSAFAKQTIARQGDLPALRRPGTWDLPAAHNGNVLRPSCVEGNATLLCSQECPLFISKRAISF